VGWARLRRALCFPNSCGRIFAGVETPASLRLVSGLKPISKCPCSSKTFCRPVGQVLSPLRGCGCFWGLSQDPARRGVLHPGLTSHAPCGSWKCRDQRLAIRELEARKRSGSGFGAADCRRVLRGHMKLSSAQRGSLAGPCFVFKVYVDGFAGVEHAAEKAAGGEENIPQGLKPRLILQTLLARLKPCPCYKTPQSEFFRSV